MPIWGYGKVFGRGGRGFLESELALTWELDGFLAVAFYFREFHRGYLKHCLS